MDNNYFPTRVNPVTGPIPDNLPDYTAPVYTPKDEPIMDNTQYYPNTDPQWYDEPDYTREVAQGMQEILNERPQLTRTEAEEQFHLTELRRLAEGYTESDAIVISQVMAKKYPWVMFNALNEEYFNMKQVVDTVTGAVQNAEQTQ